MSSILLVCTGNVCRSTMAVGLLRRRLALLRPEGHYRVFSAGTWALDGQPPSENALAVMAERGIDIRDHTAHSVSTDDVAEADLILVMSQEHADAIRRTWPQYTWKIHRLAAMAGKKKDIRDPYGEPVEAYRACADLMDGYLDRGLARILSLL